ncbi:hypothetical protein [Microbacterium memoriense]|uniref:Uncharacterized protein n=1 Tax=Microbacterium memoriense TaxID=2978350 RepID=A0ABT2PBZ8_9MICO|nr:hypothetical protein [Microbacterium memoriense]MCT9001319.1 hypothetical protein [Microbacterium memoriense]
MTTTSDSASRTLRRITLVSIVTFALGAIIVLCGIGLDWGGFGGGMAIGAGGGLCLVGAYFAGFANGFRRGPGSGASWLPSRGPAE